jgi:hypothetical protein
MNTDSNASVEDTPVFSNRCPECSRLLGEYIDATAEHLTLDGKLRMAELQWNQLLVNLLLEDVQDSAGRRIRIQRAILDHKWKEHHQIPPGRQH